jgi:predicted dehydrogenase
MPPSILVVGCGSIGERHIRNLRVLGVEDLRVFDPLSARLQQVCDEHGLFACANLAAGLATRPDAVLVCTPPHLHTEIAHAAVEAGAHVFVEKPLAHGLAGVDALLAAAAERHRIVCVGYNLRFHAGLCKLQELLQGGAIGRPLVIRAEVGQYLPDWRPGRDYRGGYNVTAAQGGGIILDASHELDYVRWLGGEVQAVYCCAGHLSNLEMDVEDTAALILRLSSGVLAEVHLDCIQRGYARTCKIIGERGTLLWDYAEGVRWQGEADREPRLLPVRPEANEMYAREMRHFLGCVEGTSEPAVDGATGRRVLEIALAAKQSAATRCEVTL